jgi:epoxyqueuosine reductase
MARNVDKRTNPRLAFPEVKSILSLGLNYYHRAEYRQGVDYGKISRYAWGDDYHDIAHGLAHRLVQRIRSIDPAFNAYIHCDSGPVMDKAIAERAGIGWMGKHTNIINRDLGSWFFIVTMYCNHFFDADAIAEELCGTCTECIDACPTDAIVEEKVIDANRCISYLTIENKGGINAEFAGKFANWIFGCDICQDVCPWNIKFALESEIQEFKPRYDETEIKLDMIEKMDEKTFKSRFVRSPVLRSKLSGFQRNAKFISSR